MCRRLDGIPLAIELAAARVNVLSIEQIDCRLNDRFRLLIGGSRTAVPRQRTLKATVDWSYDLLSDSEPRRSALVVPGRLQPARADAARIATTRPTFMELIIFGWAIAGIVEPRRG